MAGIKTASLELSTRLQELAPGWNDTEYVWWIGEPDGDYTPTEYHLDRDYQGEGHRTLRQSCERGKYVDDVIIAPDLDWLLDKLPQVRYSTGSAYTYPLTLELHQGFWRAGYPNNGDFTLWECGTAKSPCDAACALLIKLIEEKVIEV